MGKKNKKQYARYDLIDLLRGLAIVQMMVFHFCFLLKEFDLAFLDFSFNPYWAAFRVVIVTMFLTLVGVSLKIAWINGFNRRSYFKRLAQLFIYGLALSLTTYFIAPHRTVYFGILQFILVASVLGLLLVKFSWQNVVLGLGLCILGLVYSNPFFNQSGLNWLGMVTQKPVTLDYVPLLPWFGLVVIGLYIGGEVASNPRLAFIKQWQATNPVSRLLALGGRHSLNIYMAHVPIFFGFIVLFLV